MFPLVTQHGTLWHQSYFARKRFSAYSNRWVSSGWFVCFWRDSPQWARASSFPRFLDHTQRRNTVGRTPLDEWSARRRDVYLTTHTTLTTDKRPCPGGIRTHSLNRREAADLRLRPRGHWDRPSLWYTYSIKVCDVTHFHYKLIIWSAKWALRTLGKKISTV